MDGILLLNKPKGMTSHDCVNRVRKLFNTKKVGHLGTLDPDVTGVLPICINQATKIIPFIEGMTKEYVAEIALGKATDTLDESGSVTECDMSEKTIERQKFLAVLSEFTGVVDQTVPLLSAVKINGKKLYEYYRSHIEVEPPVRQVNIYETELLSEEEVFIGTEIIFKIRVLCSKGTYIRTLAYDIGERLGYPSHMKSLIRTKTGDYPLKDCMTFSDIESGNYRLLSLYEALKGYRRLEVGDELSFRIVNGQQIHFDEEAGYLVLCDKLQNVLAVYERTDKPGLYKPARVLNQ